MSNNQKQESGQEPICRRDLTELVLEPLAFQVEEARLQILHKLQGISDSIEIIAQEVARQLKRDQ